MTRIREEEATDASIQKSLLGGHNITMAVTKFIKHVSVDGGYDICTSDSADD